MLAGYGAEAINPYLAFDTIQAILPTRCKTPGDGDLEEAHRYVKAVGKGLFKVMSKMGISTYQSYCGAQIFDAVGLSSAFVDRYFTGTSTTIEGIGLARSRPRPCAGIAMRSAMRQIYRKHLDVGGDYAFRLRGEAPRLDAGDASPNCSMPCAATTPEPTPSSRASSTSRTRTC